MPDTIAIERDGAVALLTLSRPDVLNALNARMLDELTAALAAFDADRDLRAVIVTGAGTRAFAAGADIAELAALPDRAAGEAQARRGQALTRAFERLRVPTIAAVNGFALGGGCELAMACDLRIASEKARFGQPEINLGTLPGYGGTQRLARLVGEGAAMLLCLTGEMIDAAEALRIGLVQRVVPPDELLPEARRIAGMIAAKAPLAAAAVKRAILEGAGRRLDDGLAIEAAAFGDLVATADFAEGTAAFLGKRSAVFAGR